MRYGIMGAAIAATLPSVLVVVLTLREAGKIIGESFGFIAKTFVPSIMGSLVMVVGIYVWYYVSAGISHVLRLGGFCFGWGCGLYWVLMDDGERVVL